MKSIPIEIEKKLKLVVRIIEIELAFRQQDLKHNFNSFSVKSIVEISGMSERSLRDWFKEYKGINISDYIKKRKMEYGARALRLFPKSTKQEVTDIIGLSNSQSLYPFMKRGGIEDIDALRGTPFLKELPEIPYRLNRLPECIMLYTFDETPYAICGDPLYELDHWNKIEDFVKRNFPELEKVGDVGFAIDRYVENNSEEGVFISGVLYRNDPALKLSKGFRGDIGWKFIPGNKYAIFTYKGSYEGLSLFYYSALYTLSQQENIHIVKSLLIMEKYLNSPVDTSTEELMTEIWVPINN